ncbi:hypothetical protein [Pasteuria penetrans]|uniref:hypothetical protein n=1 Tax=Pasteuria penetrans TaxID=86005 RepID=UPI0011EEC9A5|nr:hypothetical protein [Pasteuria penetrans]
MFPRPEELQEMTHYPSGIRLYRRKKSNLRRAYTELDRVPPTTDAWPLPGGARQGRPGITEEGPIHGVRSSP